MVLSVSQLNEYVSAILGRDPVLRNLRVEGELSGFKRHSSGHLYFSLKDEDALIRCVMFRQSAMELPFRPQDGMRVIIDGYAALYVRDGQFQLYAKSMQQQGEGELYQKFIQMKALLAEKGYFDEERKRPIPFLPACVGIVTSKTGAALQDILQIIARRYPAMHVEVCPARVQGAGAAESIAGAIYRLNARGNASVLIVGRGGGSMEDLWAFNERIVADAIYESRLPVISAVGHETDVTIADFVADLRAPTPSAAAELCVPEYAALMQRMDELYTLRLRRALRMSLDGKRDKLRLLLQTRGFSAVGHNLSLQRQILDGRRVKLKQAYILQLSSRREALQALLYRLELRSPLRQLENGYALMTDGDGRVLSSVEALHEKMPVQIHLRDGMAQATIYGIEKQ